MVIFLPISIFFKILSERGKVHYAGEPHKSFLNVGTGDYEHAYDNAREMLLKKTQKYTDIVTSKELTNSPPRLLFTVRRICHLSVLRIRWGSTLNVSTIMSHRS